jgi:thiol-disulfide isomerase/thioredoxin
MWKSLTAVLLAGLLSAVATADDKKAEEKKADEKKAEGKLKAGDAAPAFKPSKWLQGAEVKEFASGKVYVVEFWATWCGPCIVMMPHLSELQSEYKSKGVTFIGYSAEDPNNTAEKVAAFVAKRGPKLGYTFAFGDDRTTYKAWMEAAGQNGIPCSFVIDQKGKIAYIGHPMFLGEVLPRVIAATWNVKDGANEVEKAEEDVNAVFEKFSPMNLNKDPDAALKALTDFEAKRPGLAKIPYFVGPKMALLIKAKKLDDAKKMASTLVAKAIEQDDQGSLRTVASVLAQSDVAKEKWASELSLKAADALVKVAGDKDLGALLTAANSYYSAGQKDKAKELAKKLIDAAKDQPEGIRSQIEQLTKKYTEESK